MNRLFIYIPTYNRPEALKSQLSVLVPQVVELANNVRLLISDNDSTDQMYAELKKKYSGYENVQFRQNAGNIGGNANIALGFVFAQKDEFLWILGDNDIICDSAINYILGVLNKSIDFYCFNFSVNEAIEIDYSWKQGWQTPMDWRMGLISDALYNMNSIQDSIGEAFFYHNSSFPHLAVGCAAAKIKGNVKFMLLPNKKINNNLFRSDEYPTDYSLANVCMPLLVPLFPANEARSFSIKWLRRHVVGMYLNRNTHYHLYLQTRTVLRHYGGWKAGLLLNMGWLAYFVYYLFQPYRQKCVNVLKQNTSVSSQEKLKKIREIICGK
jgi:glycosyltransferase involved in cell wall biosynthesis